MSMLELRACKQSLKLEGLLNKKHLSYETSPSNHPQKSHKNPVPSIVQHGSAPFPPTTSGLGVLGQVGPSEPFLSPHLATLHQAAGVHRYALLEERLETSADGNRHPTMVKMVTCLVVDYTHNRDHNANNSDYIWLYDGIIDRTQLLGGWAT